MKYYILAYVHINADPYPHKDVIAYPVYDLKKEDISLRWKYIGEFYE